MKNELSLPKPFSIILLRKARASKTPTQINICTIASGLRTPDFGLSTNLSIFYPFTFHLKKLSLRQHE